MDRQPSVWQSAAPEPWRLPAAPDLSLPFDLLVVGAGLSGLAAAWRARQLGLSVAVVESAEVGAGASGRNSGFIVPTLSRLSPEAVVARLGPKAGCRFLTAVAQSADALFDAIEAAGIDCAARRTGWVQAFPTATPARLGAAAHVWAEHGAEVETLDRDAMAGVIGSDHWQGGVLFRRGGHLDPLRLVQGLASHLWQDGVVILPNTPLAQPPETLAGGRAGLPTPYGPLRANRVILASGAYSHTGARPLGREVFPLTLCLALVDLGKAGESVLPGDMALSDIRRDFHFFRRGPDPSTLITGFLQGFPGSTASAAATEIRRRVTRVFGVAPLTTPMVWSGRVGLSRDGMPRLVDFAPGVHGWVGCNGRGLALSFLIGRSLADRAAGGSDTILPFTPPHPLRLPAARTLAARALVAFERGGLLSSP